MAERIIPPSTYYRVFAVLIALTFLTVGLSFLPIGVWHTVGGLFIGAVKAVLVALFFMHLIHGSKASWVMIGAGLFWLGILMVLTLTDYLTRHWLLY
ncbi:MAG TPA: cytochrome C oxidase subunit IV family protein [Gemmataceae bacterium]|jgi:cytochrome c oxidase subunit 4|nr:cytochrome C oxidase subunit IV family protein [Gemmataceae bacterium]